MHLDDDHDGSVDMRESAEVGMVYAEQQSPLIVPSCVINLEYNDDAKVNCLFLMKHNKYHHY